MYICIFIKSNVLFTFYVFNVKEKSVINSKCPLLLNNHESRVQLRAVKRTGTRRRRRRFVKLRQTECFTASAASAAAGSGFPKHKPQSPSPACEVPYLFLYKTHFVIFALIFFGSQQGDDCV